MVAITLSVVAALFWGVADFGAGLKSRRVSVFVVLSGMLIVGALTAVAMLVVTAAPAIEGRTFLLGIAAGGATAIGLTSLYRALAIGPMSVVAPISAAGVIIPVIGGLAMGDEPSAVQGAGIVLAIAGMLAVVAWSEDPAPATAGRGVSPAAVGLAVVGALGLGVYFLAAEDVTSGQATWFLLVGQLSAGSVLVIGVIARRLPIPPRIDRLQIAALGALSGGAWAFSTAAVRSGDLSLTATISSLYPVVTVVLAVAVTGESLRRVQALALVIAFAGVALIAGG